MASVTTSVAFSVVSQAASDKKFNVSAARYLSSNFETFRFRTSVLCHCVAVRGSISASRQPIQCMSTAPGKLVIYFSVLILGFLILM